MAIVLEMRVWWFHYVALRCLPRKNSCAGNLHGVPTSEDLRLGLEIMGCTARINKVWDKNIKYIFNGTEVEICLIV